MVENYRRLGVPHFQRGLVWPESSVARLLESLYYDTPCGSLILWKPRDPQAEGLPLPADQAAGDELEYLVIDGQQRIRNLYQAIGGIDTDSLYQEPESFEEQGPALETQTSRETVWCINLERIPELSAHLDAGLSEQPLFVKVVDPRVTGNPRYRYNLVPLTELLAPSEQDGRLDWELVKPASGDTSNLLASIDLRGRVRRILDREFLVITRTETATENRLADMVELYNRINSAGMRVLAEERAFASMVAARPSISRRLQRLFLATHGSRSQGNDGSVELRDLLLARRQERHYGFKLFIRTFVQAAAHHFGYSVGSSSLSFDVVNKPVIVQHLRDENAPEVEALLDQWERVLVKVAEILHGPLFCDGFQFLPETMGLVPVFQLLLKYPVLAGGGAAGTDDGAIDGSDELLTLYILRPMLADPGTRRLLEVARKVRDSNHLGECLQIIDELAIDHKALTDRLQESNTLYDRYTLMMYWLVRRHSAADFSYNNLAGAKCAGVSAGEERKIEAGSEPEKQHLVPYAWMKKVYGLSDGPRVANHPVNNIGNLTYISRSLNHWHTGLGDSVVDPGLDTAENLAAHMMDGPVVDDYVEALSLCRVAAGDGERLISSESALSAAKKQHETFCEQRRSVISRGFVQWDDELRLAVESTIERAADGHGADRLEPAPQLFFRSAGDHIRALDYDNRIEDALLLLVNRRGVSVRHMKNGVTCLRLQGKIDGRSKQLLRMDLHDTYLQLNPGSDESFRRAVVGLIDGHRGAGSGDDDLGAKSERFVLGTNGDGAETVAAVLGELAELAARRL